MSDAENVISRRQFCTGACSATLLSLFAACGSSPSSPSSSGGGGGTAVTLGTSTGTLANNSVQVTVSGSALASVGGAVVVQSVAGVFLLARTSDSAFSAIEAVCTHEGCTVNGADGSIYVCPCHGSRYDRNGHVVAGPAQASLRQYKSSFAGDVVTIAL
jgi:cytochrome b6-f complex iron-sulfur subunit